MRPESALLCIAFCLAGCGRGDPFQLREVPALEDYCLAAQRLVTRTTVPVKLVVHEDFDAFVKSKAVIEGPTIQQFVWRDADGQALGVSCKLKSADHLELQYGAGAAGPDGSCQDMNRAVFELVGRGNFEPAVRKVVFEPAETVSNEQSPGMTGPDWLAPYTAAWLEDGALHIRAKGFLVDFGDERFAAAPPRFRGVHYCHFIAPLMFERLLAGTASSPVRLGRAVDTTRYQGSPTPESVGQPAN